MVEVTSELAKEINDQHSLFQRIVVLNYTDIALSFSNAILHLGSGSLADSLTLVRPVLEYMLDMANLRLYPDAVELYEAKVNAHNLRVAENGPVARDPRDNMRFINSKTMIDKIKKHPDCTEVYREMVDRYNLVSAVAEHTSPERKTLSLRRPDDWNNIIVVLEDVAFFTFDTLYTEDGTLGLAASGKQEFENVRILLQSLRY